MSVNQIVTNPMVSKPDFYQFDGQPIKLLRIRWSVNQIVVNSMSVNQIVTNAMVSQLDFCQFNGQPIRLLPI